ncbi:unnamed protein product [Sphagnum balticum]
MEDYRLHGMKCREGYVRLFRRIEQCDMLLDLNNVDEKFCSQAAMLQFHCCGVANYTDWAHTVKYSSNTNVPDSCCRRETSKCGEHTRGAHMLNDPMGANDDDDETPVYTQFRRGHLCSSGEWAEWSGLVCDDRDMLRVLSVEEYTQRLRGVLLLADDDVVTMISFS